MSSQVFSWCFIGTGTLAKQVAAEITATDRHRIVSVVSRRKEAAEEFAARFGAEASQDPRRAMEKADAVYVVTPHTTHYPYAKMALELGKPVLCEKPMTVRAAETKELFALAAEKKVYLAEAMWTWFAPPARKVKAWVDEGRAGRIERVETVMLANVIHYAPRLTDPKLAGGAILDSGVYPITYLYRLFGKPLQVRCSGRIEGGVDLGDEIDLIWADGTERRIDLAIDAPGGRNEIRIVGSEGEIVTGPINCANYAELRGKDRSVIERFEAATTMLNEFDRVSEEIRAGRTESAFVPPRATMDVMEIMDECRRQIGLVYPFETGFAGDQETAGNKP